MMMFIENLKRLAAKNYFVTINVDGDHVQLSTNNINWQGTMDELPDYVNDIAIDSNEYINQELTTMNEIMHDYKIEDVHVAGVCYMDSEPGDPVPSMWPLPPVYWAPENNMAKAGALFTVAMFRSRKKSTRSIFMGLAAKCARILEAIAK